MIIVTGGAGFIGSNIVKALNRQGREDILVVDDLSDGRKFRNLVDCQFLDYIDKDAFLNTLAAGSALYEQAEVMFHEGACSDTTEWDGRFMMENNYDYSKACLHFCLEHDIAFIYASSAAVYGGNQVFLEHPDHEAPLNVYGYSKLLFDNYVRRLLPLVDGQVVGLRYFNVYGPRETHKGSMASVAYHFHQQLLASDTVNIFEGCDNYGNGEQRRDFIYVDDVVNVNLWLAEHSDVRGIFNVGTGRSQTFNEVADAVIAWHQRGSKTYIPFPDKLKGCYQSYTQADITKLQQAGYDQTFHTVAEGVKAYLDSLPVIMG